MAKRVMTVLDLRFASVDIVRVKRDDDDDYGHVGDGETLMVLEVNGGVMMENYARRSVCQEESDEREEDIAKDVTRGQRGSPHGPIDGRSRGDIQIPRGKDENRERTVQARNVQGRSRKNE